MLRDMQAIETRYPLLRLQSSTSRWIHRLQCLHYGCNIPKENDSSWPTNTILIPRITFASVAQLFKAKNQTPIAPSRFPRFGSMCTVYTLHCRIRLRTQGFKYLQESRIYVRKMAKMSKFSLWSLLFFQWVRTRKHEISTATTKVVGTILSTGAQS